MSKNFYYIFLVLFARSFAQTNYVMNFNGTNSLVDVGITCGNGVRSVEFWFKPTVSFNSTTALSGYSFLVRNDNSQQHEYGVYIKGSDWTSNRGRLAFFMYNNGTLHEIVSNSNSWTAGTWYHVAGVIDPVSGMQLYINGTLQSSTDALATAAIQTDNNPTKLGTWGSAGVRYYNGRMEELRLWSRAISQAEIQAKMCQDLIPANENSLQAYWKFNEGSGTQILDATANAFNGTNSGGTWVNEYACSAPNPGSYVMKFTGTNSFVNIGSQASNGVRSIECWFKPDVTINSSTTLQGATLLSRNDNTQQKEFGLYFRGTDWTVNIGSLCFFVRDNGVLHEIYSNSNSWVAGTWYHLAGVIDPINGMMLYVNGVLQSSSDPNTSAIQVDNANDAYIGTWGAAGIRYYPGRIDELRFWNRAVSQNEIQTKMCLNLIPSNETGLQAYWKFNEGGGMQINDTTSNGFNGTVNNATWLADNYCTTGINRNDNANSISIYPNPSNGIIKIEFPEQLDMEYLVCDMSGQIVRSGKIVRGSSNLDLSSISNGMYFITVKTTSGIQVSKIVIQK